MRPFSKIPPCGQSQLLGRPGVGLLVGFLPEDHRAPLGANDRVPGVFEHGHPIGDRDAEGPAKPTLADDHADDWGPEPAHFKEVLGDGLGLTTLLTADARIGTSVSTKVTMGGRTSGELHLQEGLAVSLSEGTTEVAGDLLGDGLALLLANDQGLHRSDPAESGDDRRVVPEAPVAIRASQKSRHMCWM